jgi:hypothetical protein
LQILIPDRTKNNWPSDSLSAEDCCGREYRNKTAIFDSHVAAVPQGHFIPCEETAARPEKIKFNPQNYLKSQKKESST